MLLFFFFFSSRRRHTRYWRDWSSDVCSSDLRDGVEARGVLGGDDGVELRVGEEGYFLADVLAHRAVGAADEHVGADADLAQALGGVLGRLGLELAGDRKSVV